MGEGECWGCGGHRDSWVPRLGSLGLSALHVLQKTGTFLRRPVKSPGRLSH